jgi:ribosomal protein L15E
MADKVVPIKKKSTRRLSRTARANQVRDAERRAEALAYRLQGLTFAQIGQKMGYSAERACRVVNQELEARRQEAAETADSIRELEVMRLDELQQGIYVAGKGGAVTAIDRLLKIMERRARLLGLDAPTRTALEGTLRTTGVSEFLHLATAEELAVLEQASLIVEALELRAKGGADAQ